MAEKPVGEGTAVEKSADQEPTSEKPAEEGAATEEATSEANPEGTGSTADGEEPASDDGTTVRTEKAPDQPDVPAPGELPEDPEEVAPGVKQSVPTDPAASTEFLYEGPDAAQTGVAEGAIDEERVAIVRGSVDGPNGDPLSGVRVTVLDHPEYGQTLTREDGGFDLAVNGGGAVTLVYEKDRYLPAQRQVEEVPWRDFALVEDDVAMVPFSNRVTDVDLSGTDGMLVARGKNVTDEDGTRRATTLFPEGVEAEMVMPDGTKKPLPEIDFRSTEYTAGQDGPEQMPASLPPSSGYTHAVELSVDEAVEAGADTVEFSKPVYYYTENYLEFPVGTDVPSGYYDREEGAWKASADGRILKVLSVKDGLAELDFDGRGEPADAATLEKFGVTDEERSKLAGLYEEGESLWRVPIDHLTPWDCNFPWGAPEGSAAPTQAPPAGDNLVNKQKECESGSIIECQNQVLGEALGVSGTPFSLRYGSDRVPGRTASNVLEIPLSGENPPAPLKRIELEVSVAGQSFKKSFPAEPNQEHTYVWDGKDAYGRSIVGQRDYTVRVGYAYDAVYMEPARVGASFASMSGSPMTGSSSAREFTSWQETKGKMSAPQDARKTAGMGGWSLDVLHSYDPESKTLVLGTGEERPGARDIDNVARTVAGGGSQSFFGGDGGPAKEAQMQNPSAVAVAPDGSYYIADASNNRIRKVAPDGTITTAAGNGSYYRYGSNGDGGPATQAPLSSARHIAVRTNGDLYLSDNYRIRKVGEDGIITTVAGTGTSGFSGDGGPATKAQLQSPAGLTVGSDGSLYVRDYYRVRKVAPDGTITTVAGTGTSGFSGDGGPAAEARIASGAGLAAGPDGSFYIADSNYRVRKVDADGIITTVAGNGSYPSSRQPNGDGGPATQARISPQSITVSSDDNLYINDGGSSVRKVTPDGNISTVAGGLSSGTYDDGVPATETYLNGFSGIAALPDGGFYIADTNDHSIRKVNAEGVIDTVAGSLNAGDGAKGYLNNPDGIAAAPDGSFYLADRENNRIRKLAPDGTVSTVAGTGRMGYSGDGGPATEAKLNRPLAVAAAPDGSVYFSDSYNNRVRRIDPSGLITTVAGTGVQGFSGEDGPASETQLSNPVGVALDPDGNLYIADVGNNRVRRVGTDGIIGTIAGGGTTSPGTGGPATEASLNQPRSLAVGADGGVYFTEQSGGRILKVGTDGVLSAVAGTDTRGYYGDGSAATSAQFSGISGIAFGPDGSLYVNDSGNGRVRRIEPDGIVTTVAGGGSSSYDNASGADARISGRGIAAGPDGAIYVAESSRLRKIGSFIEGNETGNISIPSEDGSEIYVFTPRGRHLRTIDAVTGRNVYEFSYDSAGRPTAIKDTDGLTTKIERDGSGDSSAIVAPNGERTELSVDSEGYLSNVSNPAGEAVRLAYGEGGLLSSLADPRGNTNRFSYDGKGRLTKDEDPAGGYKELSRRDTEKGYSVDLTTAEGRKKSYLVEPRPNGQSRRVTTDPSGLSTEKVVNSDGSLKMTAPDGTVTQTSVYSDPRFGSQSPYTGNTTIKTPGGLTLSVSRSRSAKLKELGNPLSATSITESASTNYSSWTSTYDPETKKVTDRSPAGRQTVSTVDDEGRIVREDAGGLAPTSYAYDERGRLTESTTGTDEDARTTTYTYNEEDRVASVTDPAGRETAFTYDEAGRVTEQILPDEWVIAYTYDKNGNLTSLAPPGRPDHSFSHTRRDEVESYAAPSTDLLTGSKTIYDYNQDGQPTSIVRPGGQEVTFTYDDGGRPSKTAAGAGDDAPATSYAYDEKGSLASMTAPSGTLSYAYDGPLPLSETSEGEVPGKVSYKYDNNFRVASVGVNDGASTPYSYDQDGLLARAGGLSVSRDPRHGMISSTRLDSVADSRTYDAFGQVSGYKADYMSGRYNNEPSEWFATSYERDKAGRVTEKTETVGDTTSKYAYRYDDAGRLVEAKKDDRTISTYTYDENGNRTRATTAEGGTIEATYDDQDRLTSYGPADFSYTPSGELEGKSENGQDTAYSHDGYGNLSSVVLPGGKKVEYVVDGRDRRVGKKVDGKPIQGFLYAGQLSPIAELDGLGNVKSRFVYGTKANVPDYLIKAGTTYRIVSDHLGSVRLVADAKSGEIVQRIDYDEFGKVLADSNPGFQPFGFAGGLYDRDTKLIRFGARDYDAETGRWTTKDPIGFSGGDTNLYGYVLSDPVNLLDPRGLHTGGLCAKGNLSLPGFGGMVQVCSVSDGRNLGNTFSWGGGLETPTKIVKTGKLFDTGGSASIQGTNAGSVSDLSGGGGYAGWSAGQGVVVDGSTRFSYDDCGNVDASGWEAGVGPGVKGGIPIGASGGYSRTYATQVPIKNFTTAGTPVFNTWGY